MKRLLIFVGLLFIQNLIAQTFTEDRYYFQTNIANASSLTITENPNGALIIVNKRNSRETKIFGKYRVYDFKIAYPNTKSDLLKTVYTIVTNKVELLGALKHNFPKKYTRIDQFYPTENAYYPNDYGATSPIENMGTYYPLHDLDLVNAPGAWGITKGSNQVIIGITDSKIDSTNADLKDRVSNYLYYRDSVGQSLACAHGGSVAGIAIARMNNGYGRPGMCSECDVIATGYGNFGYIEDLVDAGARVINASWAICRMGKYHENIEERINEFYEDGIIIVAGAGNAKNCNKEDDFPADDYAYPASFEKVISATGVFAMHRSPTDTIFVAKEGTKATTNLRDRHKREIGFREDGTLYPKYVKWGMQHNESIDICAPAESYLLGHDICGYEKPFGGASSSAAPYITGTIGLMWSVNYCLSAYEVESIIKLTSADIENLAGNERFRGKLGAGRLDAYKAVKMAQQMKDSLGTVEISDRDFYRFYFRLENSPFNIRIRNQTFRDSSKVDFKARNGIVLKANTHLKPDRNGYVKLSTEPLRSTAECFAQKPKEYDRIFKKK
jgi:subtilisin family serine protease